jgi:hypothetical protein
MDTTSHNFTWQIFEFGNFGTSILYDVAIINENDIWAVGEIYVADTSSTGYTMYNAVHWDGNKWELKKILYKNGFWPIRAVYAFNSNDIWFSGYMRYYNGRFIELNIPDILIGWGIEKIWGMSSNDMYAVGDYGNIVHWDGKRWTKIESGTQLHLLDIIGGHDERIYISGSNNTDSKGILLSIDKQNKAEIIVESEILDIDHLFKPKLYGELATVWIDNHDNIYTGGNLIFRQRFGVWNYLKSLPENYINGNANTYYRGFVNRIRGRSSNDFWIIGERNTLKHFNGINWVQIGLPYNPYSPINWKNIDIKGNLVVIVGNDCVNALLILIKN